MSSTELQAPMLEPPRARLGPIDWLRRNLFNSWFNSLITLVLLVLLPLLLFQLAHWLFTEATWRPVVVNLRLLWVGRYPPEQVWRVGLCATLVLALFGLSGGIWRGIMRDLAAGLAAATLLLALLPFGWETQLWLAGTLLLLGVGYLLGWRWPQRLRWPAMTLWLLSPLVLLILIGGMNVLAVLLPIGIDIPFVNAPPGQGVNESMLLPPVAPDLWGGLLLTIMLAVVSIIASFPLGVLLALGRRSELPVVRGFCIAYIECVRGVPLITVLFIGFLVLPLFLPAGLRIPNVTRAMVALTLFSAAYLAENVRGGLQAVPRGQVEAARALGLNVFQTTLLIVLPQALRAVIPAIVGQFIALFKDTSLVAIVGLADLLGIAGIIYNQPEWLTVSGGVDREVLLFVAAVYWVFCFTMAQVSHRIETNLGVGTR